MIPNPIHRVLSTLSSRGVRRLLMGGQACVFYGAAEFSRDCDIVLLADEGNLQRLRDALAELDAVCIAVPPFEAAYLLKGHAVHFRCRQADVQGMRLDVMTRLRGCDEFDVLWSRRTTLTDADGFAYEVLELPDLVRAKKTQRDKDWPMIRRLVDAHYEQHRAQPTDEQVRFWLHECRSPEALIAVAARHPALRDEVAPLRPAVTEALSGSCSAVQAALDAERAAEQARDAAYWQPLKRELEALQRPAGRGASSAPHLALGCPAG